MHCCSFVVIIIIMHTRQINKRGIVRLSVYLVTEDGLRAWGGTSVRLRGAPMGGGIRSFSEKLHEIGDGTFREHHAVLRQFREDRVSELCEIFSRPNQQNVAQESEKLKIPEFESFNDPTACALIASTVQNGNFRYTAPTGFLRDAMTLVPTML